MCSTLTGPVFRIVLLSVIAPWGLAAQQTPDTVSPATATVSPNAILKLPPDLEPKVARDESGLQRAIASGKLLHLENDITLATKIVSLRRKYQGDDWWETKSAIRILVRLNRIEAMTPNQRLQLVEAGEDLDKAAALNKENRYQDALESQAKAAELLKSLGGENDPQYAAVLSDLAGRYERQGRYGDA